MPRRNRGGHDAYSVLAAIAFTYIVCVACGMTWTLIVPAGTVGWVVLILNGDKK